MVLHHDLCHVCYSFMMCYNSVLLIYLYVLNLLPSSTVSGVPGTTLLVEAIQCLQIRSFRWMVKPATFLGQTLKRNQMKEVIWFPYIHVYMYMYSTRGDFYNEICLAVSGFRVFITFLVTDQG